MKILVTGGAGFIGSNFIRYWLQTHSKDKVTNLDKLTYAGHLSSTKDFIYNKNYKFIRGDICNIKTVENAVKDTDIIVHFAAESHVDRSIKNSKTFLNTNILGTHTLLEAAVKYKVKHFHHVSTDEVFGSLELNSKAKFTENSSYDPRSPYAASKASSDHLVRAYFETFNLPITITNCSNNFGPYQDPEKLLPRFITNLIENRKVPVYGDGKNVRDWLYVDDHVRAIELVIQKGKIGQTYLVGGMTKDVNNLELTYKLLKIFNKNRSYVAYVKDRPGHDRRYAVDWGKINKELGWEPKHDFEQWLEKTVQWYIDNGWWWKPLKNNAEKFYNKS